MDPQGGTPVSAGAQDGGCVPERNDCERDHGPGYYLYGRSQQQGEGDDAGREIPDAFQSKPGCRVLVGDDRQPEAVRHRPGDQEIEEPDHEDPEPCERSDHNAGDVHGAYLFSCGAVLDFNRGQYR